jgi:hypothetical protein
VTIESYIRGALGAGVTKFEVSIEPIVNDGLPIGVLKPVGPGVKAPERRFIVHGNEILLLQDDPEPTPIKPGK